MTATQVDSSIVDENLHIENLDFRRGEVGEGNILFELEDDEVNTDVSVSGNTIEVRFFDVSLQESLQRVFDVQDFATPISTFSAENVGRDSVVEITTVEPFEYLAYQTDTQYVVSVKPRARPGTPGAENEFNYTGEKLSLNFQDIEVRAVLQLIADFTELNLVASDTVNGSITLRLQNVPWDQALDIVLKAKGLDQRREGNVLLVAPIAEIAERERLEIEAGRQLQELAPLSTEYIRIRYADATQLFDLLSSTGSNGEETQKLLSPRGSAIVDQRTNTIVLTDVAEKIESFRRMIDELDIPIRQVLIEARIVIA
ncbi:MAG: secretin N-terminal domain-containing protein, partial [Pseudomonadales bacterium]